MRYSGRIDQVYDEMYYYQHDDEQYVGLTMMEIFDNFVEHYSCNNYIFAFEDKDKTGVFPRKPHYHFIFETDEKQDTMRRYFTKCGFKGALCALHKIESNEEFEKAIYYTLKQQHVVFTDIEDLQLQQYLSSSRNYNVDIAKSKNITMDILEKVVNTLNVSTPDRRTIAWHIYKEYELINASANTWEQYYCVPNGIQLLRMIQYVESKTTLNSYDRWYADNERIITPEQTKIRTINEYKQSAYERIYDDIEL